MKGYTKRIALSLLCALLPYTGFADDELQYEFEFELQNPEYSSGTTRTVIAGDTFISNIPHHDGDSIAEGGIALRTPNNQILLEPHESLISTRYGQIITLGNDHDGDGIRELLVTAPSLLISPNGGQCGDGQSVCGAVFAFNIDEVLTSTTQMPPPVYTLLSTQGTDFGEVLQYVNQNGKELLAVSSPSSDTVELFDLDQVDPLTNAPLRVSTAEGCEGSDFGRALNLIGDLNGDGYQELGIGAPSAYGDGACNTNGAAHLMEISQGTLEPLQHGILLHDDEVNEESFGSAISAAGPNRIAVASRLYGEGFNNPNMGRVTVFERQSDQTFEILQTLVPTDLFDNMNFAFSRLGTSLQYLEGSSGEQFLHIGGDGNAVGQEGEQGINNGSLLVVRLEDQSLPQKAMLYEVGHYDRIKYGQSSQIENLDLIPNAQLVATFAPQLDNESEGIGYMRAHSVATSTPTLLAPAYGGRGTGTPCFFYENASGPIGGGENIINPSVTTAIPAPVIGQPWELNFVTIGGDPYPESELEIEIRPSVLTLWSDTLLEDSVPITPGNRCAWHISLQEAVQQEQFAFNNVIADAPIPIGDGTHVQTTLTPFSDRWQIIPESLNGKPTNGQQYYVQSLITYNLCTQHQTEGYTICVNTGYKSLTEAVAVQIGEVDAGMGIPTQNPIGGQP